MCNDAKIMILLVNKEAYCNILCSHSAQVVVFLWNPLSVDVGYSEYLTAVTKLTTFLQDPICN